MKEKETDKQAAVTNEKLKALQTAMDKIEKSYGKGSIMRMGEQNIEAIPVIPTGSIGLNAALGVGVVIPEEESLRFTVRNHLVKQHWLFMPLQKPRKQVVLPHLLMRNTLLTVSMLRSWVLKPTTFSCLSRIMASKRWRLQSN